MNHHHSNDDATKAVEQRLNSIAKRLGDVIADAAGAHSRSKIIRPDDDELVSIIREIAGYVLNAPVEQGKQPRKEMKITTTESGEDNEH
jgi:hypothetical protein